MAGTDKPRYKKIIVSAKWANVESTAFATGLASTVDEDWRFGVAQCLTPIAANNVATMPLNSTNSAKKVGAQIAAHSVTNCNVLDVAAAPSSVSSVRSIRKVKAVNAAQTPPTIAEPEKITMKSATANAKFLAVKEYPTNFEKVLNKTIPTASFSTDSPKTR